MNSDLWEILNLLTTIVVGFYITHWYSVRDTRTRALKDNYIAYLNKIREKVEDFFQNILDGQYSGKNIVSWYTKIEPFIIPFDEGIRNFLPIKQQPLQGIIFNVYSEITNSQYYNDHFKDKKMQMNNETRDWIIQKKKAIDVAINDYLLLVNNSRNFNIYRTAKQEIEYDAKYYKEVEHRTHPKRKAYKEFLISHLGNIFVVIIVISFLIIIIFKLYLGFLAILVGWLHADYGF